MEFIFYIYAVPFCKINYIVTTPSNATWAILVVPIGDSKCAGTRARVEGAMRACHHNLRMIHIAFRNSICGAQNYACAYPTTDFEDRLMAGCYTCGALYSDTVQE